jgi:hypothetical protein
MIMSAAQHLLISSSCAHLHRTQNRARTVPDKKRNPQHTANLEQPVNHCEWHCSFGALLRCVGAWSWYCKGREAPLKKSERST